MKAKYQSNITVEQFERIRGILDNIRKKTKPRKIDLYEVFNGILYILKSGCQWRMLPKEFPKWETVYYYFQIWSNKNKEWKSKLEEILEKLVEEEHIFKKKEKNQH